MARQSKLTVLAQERGKSVPDLLKEAYQQHGNQTSVARALGVAQSTLSQNLVKFNLREVVTLTEGKAS